MRIKSKYKLQTIAGDNIIILHSDESSSTDMTRVISLNNTSAWLWNQLADTDFCIEDIVRLLCLNYDVSPETAYKDAQKWINILNDNNIVN